MRNGFVLLVIIFTTLCAEASSINNAVYKTMQASSYRANYNSQVNNKVVPYWQAQSNFSTRNKMYQNYSNYNNSVYKYNRNIPYSHRRYR